MATQGKTDRHSRCQIRPAKHHISEIGHGHSISSKTRYSRARSGQKQARPSGQKQGHARTYSNKATHKQKQTQPHRHNHAELEQTKWPLRQTQQLAVHKQPLRHRQQPCNQKLLGQKRQPTGHKRQQIGNEQLFRNDHQPLGQRQQILGYQ